METTDEFLRSLGVVIYRDGRRRWPEDVKARIVAETLLPGATVNAVAAKYAVRANHISEWRRRARDGKLVLPVLEAEPEFAPLVLFDTEPAQAVADATADEDEASIDLLFASVTIRLNGATPAARVAEIARALGGGA